MSTYQNLTIVGNLGENPDFRFMPNGSVVKISVATTEKWKDKPSGEQKEHTEWHKVVLYNRLAEIARDYLKKGSKVLLVGRLKTRKFQRQGSDKDEYITEMIANELTMLDSNPNKGQQQGGFNQNQPQGQQQGGFKPYS